MNNWAEEYDEPGYMFLDDKELPRGVTLCAFTGADGAMVFQIDTQDNTGRIRVNVNDAPIFDQDPEEASRINYAALSREVI